MCRKVVTIKTVWVSQIQSTRVGSAYVLEGLKKGSWLRILSPGRGTQIMT